MSINCEDLIFDFIVVSTVDLEPIELGLLEDDKWVFPILLPIYIFISSKMFLTHEQHHH